MKPIGLMSYPIRNSTMTNGIVLDPFLGSGTTAAVAKQMGRHYIGIELNPDYCTLAEQRIGSAAGSEGDST